MNLKEILDLYAKYNKYANGEMARVLGGPSPSRAYMRRRALITNR